MVSQTQRTSASRKGYEQTHSRSISALYSWCDQYTVFPVDGIDTQDRMVEVPEHVAHSVRRLLNQQDDMAFHGTESVQTCEVSTLRLSTCQRFSHPIQACFACLSAQQQLQFQWAVTQGMCGFVAVEQQFFSHLFDDASRCTDHARWRLWQLAVQLIWAGNGAWLMRLQGINDFEYMIKKNKQIK